VLHNFISAISTFKSLSYEFYRLILSFTASEGCHAVDIKTKRFYSVNGSHISIIMRLN
jgi:hypothetical protein